MEGEPQGKDRVGDQVPVTTYILLFLLIDLMGAGLCIISIAVLNFKSSMEARYYNPEYYI